MAAAVSAKAKKTWTLTWRRPSVKEFGIGLVTLWVFVAFSSQLRGRDNVLGSIPTFLAYVAWMVGTFIKDTWHALCFFGSGVVDAWLYAWGDIRPVGFVLTAMLIGLVVQVIQKGLTRGVMLLGILTIIPSAFFLLGVLGAAGLALEYWVKHSQLVAEVIIATFLAFGAILLTKGGAPIHAPKGGGGGGHH